MHKILRIFFITILLTFLFVPISSYAEGSQTAADSYYSQIDEILADHDIGYGTEELSDKSFGELSAAVTDSIGWDGTDILSLLGTILIVIVVTAALKASGEGLSDSSADIFGTVSVLTAVTAIVPKLFEVFGRASSAVQSGGSFIAVFIPVFSGITAAMGGITSAGVYDVAVLGASEIFVQLSSLFMMPVVTASTMLAVTGSVFSGEDLGSIVRLGKKLVTWGMTVAMTLFTGLLTMKCTLSGKADGAAAKTTRFVISGMVPVVGGAVSDAYSTVRGSFDLIRGTVGTAGCIAVILLFLPPVLQILIFRAVMWTGTAAAELFSVESVAKLLKALDDGLAIVQCILVCFGLMFMFSTAILLQNAGG